jgi:PAS domain S-box-containing protein
VGSASLVAAVQTAARTALQQARVHTTLEGFNIRLRRSPVLADERQQHRLLLSGLYFASVLEHASDGIFVTDRQGVVALWNRAAEQLFGVDAAAIVGHTLDLIPSAQRHQLAELVGRLTTSSPRKSTDLTLHTPAGDRDVELSLNLVFDPEGQPIAVSGIARDVTARKALAQALRDKADALATSNRHKEEFLAVLSHELRTPLNAVLGWAQILRSHPLDAARVQKAADVIYRNAELQQRLVLDLLDYARMSAGQLQLQIEEQDLAAITKGAVESFRPELARCELSLATSYEDAIRVAVDPPRLRQVVTNLVSNAIKFTPPGGRVSVRVHRRAGAGVIEVADTGRGIDPEFLPHVFDEFRQADPSHSRSQQGLGLGLAITRRIVELHGGTITAASEGPNRGATFRVTLPCGSVA